MRRRLLSFLVVLGLLMPIVGAPHPGMSAPASLVPTFVAPQFEQVWSRTDLPVAQGQVARSWVWGPARAGGVQAEPFAGEPGGTRTVQYFDKARMEVNRAAADPSSQWATTTGLLVVEMVSGRVQVGPDSYEARTPADVPVAGDASQDAAAPLYSSFRGVASLPGGPERRVAQATGSLVTATIDRAGSIGSLDSSDVRYSAYSPETGHNIPDVFQRFMQSRDLVNDGGSLQQGQLMDPVYVLGYPITEAYWATVPIDGKPVRVLVQLYQRRVLTYVPGYSPAWQVQMGNVGQHYYTWRYTAPASTIPSPASTPTAAPGADDAFLHVSGSQFYYKGQPTTLKGTNYWLHLYLAGAGTWDRWDGPLVQQELAKAKELGVNSIRIGIPYDVPPGMDVVWGEGCGDESAHCDHVNGRIVEYMTQLLQIASAYDMKVLFTLFHDSGQFPAEGTAEWRRQITYMQALVTPFASDDRVIGWDLRNEPENYDFWKSNGPAPVIEWADGMSKAVRAIDSRHLLTLGVASFDTLWLEANGKRIIDMVDFASFHCYSAGGLSGQIAAIKAHTSKPVLLEEMGWPTGPAKLSSPAARYDEATQQFLYRSMLKDVKDTGIAGIMQWTLGDNPLGDEKHYVKATIQYYFGLVRNDGSYKPAAFDFRDMYIVPALPSSTTTRLPFTTP